MVFSIMSNIRIQFSNAFGDIFYLFNNTKGQWTIASRSGMGEAFSNFTDDAMLLRFALEDATSAEQALDALNKHSKAKHAYILGGQ